MKKNYLNWKIAATLVVALGLGFFNLSSDQQTAIFPQTPDFITESKINLGLDLQGGSQLEYKLVLPDNLSSLEKQEIIDRNIEEIAKRVDRQGISEPQIFTTEIEGETYITVEVSESANITQEDVDEFLNPETKLEDLTEDQKQSISLEKLKKEIGKTIQLEFKVLKDNVNDEEELAGVREKANATLAKIKEGADFSITGQEEAQKSPADVSFEETNFTFESEMREELAAVLRDLQPGQIAEETLEIPGNFTQDPISGQIVQKNTVDIVRLLETREKVKDAKSVETSHVLVTFEGAENATTDRTEEEALARAQEAKAELENGTEFSEIVSRYSDDSATKENDGRQEVAVVENSNYGFEYEEAALAFTEAGQISEVVKTQQGFHIIKAEEIKTDVKETQYKYETISYSLIADPWEATGLTGKQFERADVSYDHLLRPIINISFDSEGAELFKQLTEENLNRQIAIYVGGELISAPNVNQVIGDGIAQITGNFTPESAQTLKTNLNTGAIAAPMIITGEYTIGATLGQDALEKSLMAGALGLALVMIFMLLYYRLSGLIASIALVIYGLILIFLLKASLGIIASVTIALLLFVYTMYKIVNSEDSGLDKFFSFVLAMFGLGYLTNLLSSSPTMTLAGIAGLILSIGMAVDANILIFERIKEELKSGKPTKKALSDGFNRAWTAIRDSNFSTLLTCAILYYFGSSIIQGFAFNLAAGILVSMFTAITITRLLMEFFIGRKEQTLNYASSAKKAVTNYIKHSKKFFAVSGALVIAAFVLMGTIGFNPGIDFTGGSLIQAEFAAETTKEEIASTFEASAEQTELELGEVQVVESEGNSFVIKTKQIDPDKYTELITAAATQLPEFTISRFNSIGPTIGESLQKRAIQAIVLAIIMIIAYITFAFRKVPKSVRPWKFGVAAIVALVHDVVIVTGIFVILGYTMGVEINALYITAMLTVFGYSVNDTIVVLDRFRENLMQKRSNEDLADVANRSLSETMARSINTSVSTLITLIAILIWGSESIFFFVLALTLGAFVGTYSSLFIATPLLAKWNEKK